MEDSLKICSIFLQVFFQKLPSSKSMFEFDIFNILLPEATLFLFEQFNVLRFVQDCDDEVEITDPDDD